MSPDLGPSPNWARDPAGIRSGSGGIRPGSLSKNVAFVWRFREFQQRSMWEIQRDPHQEHSCWHLSSKLLNRVALLLSCTFALRLCMARSAAPSEWISPLQNARQRCTHGRRASQYCRPAPREQLHVQFQPDAQMPWRTPGQQRDRWKCVFESFFFSFGPELAK